MIPSEKILLDLLSNNDVTFFIPPYQRNYEWNDEQCKRQQSVITKNCIVLLNASLMDITLMDY